MPLINRHFTSIEELEEAQLARCAGLQRQPERIRSTTLFHWWPQRLEKTTGTQTKLISSLLALAQDTAQQPAQQPHCARDDPEGLDGSGAIRNEVRRSEAGHNDEKGDGAEHEERAADDVGHSSDRGEPA
jgi:hypothetical protein